MKQPTLLVTGGAGYIGSHMLLALRHLPFKVIVVDNLTTGLRSNVVHGTLIEGDLRNRAFVQELFATYDFDAVLHFAASVSVSESIRKPDLYYENNSIATYQLVRACLDHHIKHFLFSSTAAVYGDQGEVTEASPPNPMNPYGRSKWLAEIMIRDCLGPTHTNYGILRYFNVAGVDPSLTVGPSAHKDANLFKGIIETALGKRPMFQIFGCDYDTPDGTGVRDYIHVNDLIAAHLLLLKHMMIAPTKATYNCSYGCGYSVSEVVKRAQTLFNAFPVIVAPKRDGDPAKMIASPQRLVQDLGWKPQHDDIDQMLKSQMLWEQKQLETVL